VTAAAVAIVPAVSTPSAAPWKCAYLIHGDDHGRITERRAGLRARAEAESDSGGIELFEGDEAAPETVAAALCAMTFATGRRFLVVDGVERWKDEAVKTHLASVLADVSPDTTVAFFGREDGRQKVPAALVKAVTSAGGVVKAEVAVKGKDMIPWVRSEAGRHGIELDQAGAATLVTEVGERQQRLVRELEKLSLYHGRGARLGEEQVRALAAPSSENQVWGFVDAIAGNDGPRAVREYLVLREQGESLARLVPMIAKRLREVLGIADRLALGEAPAQIKASWKGNPWAADRRIREARGADPERLRGALEILADLELDTRGGSMLDQETSALLAIGRIAA
jgi:DNA polymerase-3 subunit delta